MGCDGDWDEAWNKDWEISDFRSVENWGRDVVHRVCLWFRIARTDIFFGLGFLCG